MLEILRGAKIEPLPVQQYRVRLEGRTYVLDSAWPDAKVGLEYHGDPHFTVSALHDDLDRLRRFQRGGWTLWPFTDHTSRAEMIAIGRDTVALLAA